MESKLPAAASARRLESAGATPAQIQALREIGSEFHRRGWSAGSSGNFSVRLSGDPVRLLVTASGADKGRLTEHDFVVVDGDGRAVDPEMPPPSAETALHMAIYRPSTAGAVLHVHTVWATMLSELHRDEEGFCIEGHEMLKGLAGVRTHEHRERVEIFENSQDMHALSRRVGDRLADAARPLQHGFILRRHGLYTWGRDLTEARRHVEVFEFLFEVLARRG